jgi:3-oxoacyl-[acyl-carrier-protein] synthase II
VLTGVGVVCPIGIGRQKVWESFEAGRSGIRPLAQGEQLHLPVRIGGEVHDFDPKAQALPRRSLKVMARDAQLGVAASILASQDARIESGGVDPERFGVILGADRMCSTMEHSEPPYRKCMVDGAFDFGRWGPEGMPATFPLAFLRIVPNMIASHISIVHDARGPNNTIHHAEVSGLLAVIEAARVIQRGMADVMLAGGASSQTNPYDWVRHCASGRLSPQSEPPEGVMRPFDAGRTGEVRGEGAAMFLLESRQHAMARGVPLLARVAGWGAAFECHTGRRPEGCAVRRAVQQALDHAGLPARGLGHVNAHGAGTIADDALEARAIRDVLDDVPVTAPRSYFGNLGAAAGAVELVATVLGLGRGLVPPTLNYKRPDPACPLRVIARDTLAGAPPTALALNWTSIGQAAAVVLTGPE